MDEMRIGVALIGTGGLVAGVIGVLLPSHHRLGAALALVAGAGVGVIVLAIGAGPDADDPSAVFLAASVLGLITEIAVLALSWSRARREGTTHPPA